jgi:thiol-disulfide isomerase/thioredoxin
MKDQTEPFRFSFPDLNGRVVSNADARFRGKVLVVEITGSWCPNCHDEAPFLAEMYRKYGRQEFEIVSLSFEEADQLKDPTRLRAFVKSTAWSSLYCCAATRTRRMPNSRSWSTGTLGRPLFSQIAGAWCGAFTPVFQVPEAATFSAKRRRSSTSR